jgi:hypothetical protein
MSSLKTQEIEEILVVNFTDAKILDEARITQIGQELMACAASAGQKKKMLLNFQGVQFMSCAVHVLGHDWQARIAQQEMQDR